MAKGARAWVQRGAQGLDEGGWGLRMELGGSHSPLFLGPHIECSDISDYAVTIVKVNKLDHGELRKSMGWWEWSGEMPCFPRASRKSCGVYRWATDSVAPLLWSFGLPAA